ncbi:hypothetical protein T439DRAFT_359620 [Meredithblackwellia eburnea MCA 4105]
MLFQELSRAPTFFPSVKEPLPFKPTDAVQKRERSRPRRGSTTSTTTTRGAPLMSSRRATPDPTLGRPNLQIKREEARHSPSAMAAMASYRRGSIGEGSAGRVIPPTPPPPPRPVSKFAAPADPFALAAGHIVPEMTPSTRRSMSPAPHGRSLMTPTPPSSSQYRSSSRAPASPSGRPAASGAKVATALSSIQRDDYAVPQGLSAIMPRSTGTPVPGFRSGMSANSSASAIHRPIPQRPSGYRPSSPAPFAHSSSFRPPSPINRSRTPQSQKNLGGRIPQPLPSNSRDYMMNSPRATPLSPPSSFRNPPPQAALPPLNSLGLLPDNFSSSSSLYSASRFKPTPPPMPPSFFPSRPPTPPIRPSSAASHRGLGGGGGGGGPMGRAPSRPGSAMSWKESTPVPPSPPLTRAQTPTAGLRSPRYPSSSGGGRRTPMPMPNGNWYPSGEVGGSSGYDRASSASSMYGAADPINAGRGMGIQPSAAHKVDRWDDRKETMQPNAGWDPSMMIPGPRKY